VTRFDRHTVVLLTRPADAPDLPRAELDRIQDAHLAAQADLYDQGLLVGVGPFAVADDEPLRGLAVLATDPEHARRLYEADPAVRAGRLAVQVLTWMVPTGSLQFLPVAPPRSVAEATAP
jgi:uncharacterized protein